MKESARYPKIVEWSDEDQCYIGSAPGMIGGCCHGDDEQEVFAELCQIVEEWVRIYKEDRRPLPPPLLSIRLPAYDWPNDDKEEEITGHSPASQSVQHSSEGETVASAGVRV